MRRQPWHRAERDVRYPQPVSARGTCIRRRSPHWLESDALRLPWQPGPAIVFEANSESPRHTAVTPIIGHGLESVVLNSHRQIRAGLDAQAVAPGEGNLRSDVPGRRDRKSVV